MKKLFILLSFTASLFAMQPDGVQSENDDLTGITLRVLDHAQKNKAKDTDYSIVYITPEDLQLLQQASKTIRDVTEEFDGEEIYLPNMNREAFEFLTNHLYCLFIPNHYAIIICRQKYLKKLREDLCKEETKDLLTLTKIIDYLNISLPDKTNDILCEIIAQTINTEGCKWLLNREKYQSLRTAPVHIQQKIAQKIITKDSPFCHYLISKSITNKCGRWKDFPHAHSEKQDFLVRQTVAAMNLPSNITIATNRFSFKTSERDLKFEAIQKREYHLIPEVEDITDLYLKKRFQDYKKPWIIVKKSNKLFLINKETGNIIRSFDCFGKAFQKVQGDRITHFASLKVPKKISPQASSKDKYHVYDSYPYQIWYLEPLYQIQEYVDNLDLFQKLLLITAHTFAQKKTSLKIEEGTCLHDIYKSLPINNTMTTILLKKMTVKLPIYNPIAHFYKLYIAKDKGKQ